MKRFFLILQCATVMFFVALGSPILQAEENYETDCGNDSQENHDCKPSQQCSDRNDPSDPNPQDDPDNSQDDDSNDCDDTGANPINANKANHHREVTDVNTFGAARISFTRNCNSRTSDFNDPYWELGYRQIWQHNWNYEVRKENSTTIKVRYPDGNDYNFKTTDGVQFIPAADNGDRLYKWPGSTIGYTLLASSGRELDFRLISGTNGVKFQLTQIRNGLGFYWNCTYDSNNRLTRITNNFGRWIQIDRETGADGVLRISQVSTTDGRVVAYGYSLWASSGKFVLTSVNYPGGEQATYSYATSDPSSSNARPLLSTATDPAYRHGKPGAQMKYTYNYNANFNFGGAQTLVTGTLLEERNKVTDQTVVSFPLGSGAYPKVQEGDGTLLTRKYTNGLLSTKGDGEGRMTTYTRGSNGFGFVASKTGPNGAVTQYTRDYAGRVLTKTDALGHTRSHAYNSKGFMLTKTDELGHTITWTRDSNNRRTHKDYPDNSYETWTYNAATQPLTHRLRNGGTESFAYNSLGNKTAYTDPLGNTTTYTYYTNGLVSSVTDARLNTTSYTYDTRGQVLTITHPDTTTIAYQYDTFGNRTSVTDELGHTTTTTYDEYNRVKTGTDPLGRTTTYEYGRAPGCNSCSYANTITRITSPSGRVISYDYDASGLRICQTIGAGTSDAATTTYAYDAAKNLVSMTDPRGKIWRYGYDDKHRKTSATDPLGNTTQWTYDQHGNKLTEARPDGGVTQFAYDARDRLIQTTDPAGNVTHMTYNNADKLLTLTDPRNNSYSFSYDVMNRKTALFYPATNPGDGENSGATSEGWTYDPAGNTATYRTRAGKLETFTYDNRNRETQSNWSNGAAPTMTRSYDAAGRLLTLNTAASNLSYAYDNANQLTSETQNVVGLGAKTISYTYDGDGNRLTLTYPDSDVVHFAYTNRNQLNNVTVNNTPALATYGYDLNGNRTSKTLSNGTNAAYGYDNANRLLSINHQNGNGTFSSFAYGYNSVGNRRYVQRENGRGDVYSYDAINQLTGAKYEATNPSGTPSNPQGVESFTYDPAGNWLTQNDINYQTNALNQYTGWTSDDGGGGDLLPEPNPYGYDANGNLTDNPSWTNVFDAQNRLASATSSLPPSFHMGPINISYDARNRPVKRVFGTTTTYLVYDGWNLVAEFDASGNQIAKYVHGANIDEVLERIGLPANVYYHHDGLGSTAKLTNSVGAVVEQYSYSVFGSPRISTASGGVLSASAYGNRFMFTGREYFAWQGMYDYRNRIYLPALGRFMQTDPMRFQARDVNLYRYVRNRVTSHRDAMGRQDESPPIDLNGGDIELEMQLHEPSPKPFPSQPELPTSPRALQPEGEASWNGTYNCELTENTCCDYECSLTQCFSGECPDTLDPQHYPPDDGGCEASFELGTSDAGLEYNNHLNDFLGRAGYK
jgi:RHS repeat-associated protein